VRPALAIGGSAVGNAEGAARTQDGDITTHYSVPEIAELLTAVQKICTAKGTPAIILLRVAA